MFDSVMKLLVKDYGTAADPKIREKSGRAAGTVGIATNLLLFLIKFLPDSFLTPGHYGGRREQPDGFRLLHYHAGRLQAGRKACG